MENPILGIGPGNYIYASYKYNPYPQQLTYFAHNSFLCFVVINLKRQINNPLFFTIGICSLLVSLLSTSWNNQGIFAISLIYIFNNSGNTSQKNKLPPLALLILPIICCSYLGLVVTSNNYAALKNYSQSIIINPFNLDSQRKYVQLSNDTTKYKTFFYNEQSINQAVAESTSFPNNISNYLKLVEINPQNNFESLINIIEYVYKTNSSEIYSQLEKLNLSSSVKQLEYPPNISLAKRYYQLGIDLWRSNQKRLSVECLSKAAEFSVGYSHFYIEVANAQWNSNNHLAAINTIYLCLKIPFSAKHCQNYLDTHPSNFDPPGIFESYISRL